MEHFVQFVTCVFDDAERYLSIKMLSTYSGVRYLSWILSQLHDICISL